MIDIRELEFEYHSADSDNAPAFRLHIDELTIAAGTSAALVGPSGSGKTTLLGLISGTLRPSAGLISINDKVISGLSERALGQFRIRHVGQVFQSFELLNYLNVLENVMLPWLITGNGDKSNAKERAANLLGQVGLASKARSRPDELSRGEQQRIAVCRAMLNEPGILLAGEPTGNLDQKNKQMVVDLLKDQAHTNHSTLLMVTHDESLLTSFDTVFDIQRIAEPPGATLRR